MLSIHKISLLFVGLIFFSTPFESFALIEHVSIVKISALIVVGVFTAFLFKQGSLRWHWVYYLFFPYIVLIGLSTIWSIAPVKTFNSFLFVILPSFILSIVIFNVVKTGEAICSCLRAYGVAASMISGYVALSMVFGYSVGAMDLAGRVTVLGQDPNELAMLLLFGLSSILALKFYFQTYILFKIKYIDFFVFSSFLFCILLAVFMTGSRTGFVVTVFIMLMSSFFFNRYKQALIVFCFSSALVAIFFVVSPEMGERLLQIDLEESGGGSGRTRIWAGVLQYFGMGQEYIIGTGFKTFENVALMAIHSARAGHNTYLIVFIELGVLGVFAYCLKVVPVFILAGLKSRYLIILTLVLLAPYLIGSLTLGLESRRWFFIFHPLIMSIIMEAKYKRAGMLDRPHTNSFREL